MRPFVELLLRKRLLVLSLAAVLAAAGAVAWTRLPIDAFPDVTNVQVMVLTEAPGLSAADVEQQVTWPVEQQMGGVPKVTQVRSLSKPGLSQVVVVFEDGTDVYFARQQVGERLEGAKGLLPAGAEPELGPISTGLGEIFQYTLEGEGMSPAELRAVQDFLVAPRLKPVPGVNEVNSFGGHVRQYHVNVRPDALVKHRLSLREVTEALARNNANAAGGFIVRGWEQSYVRGLGLLEGAADIRRVAIRTSDGAALTVGDVADVTEGVMPRQGAVTRDGKGEAVAGMVIMLRGENSKDVVSRVKEEIGRIAKGLPKGVSLNVFYDRTSLIEACIRTVMDALREGGIFVVVILFLFLAELRTALIVVLTLPLTFLCTFLLMGWAGITSNLMSLGGLAFSVGMVVDAAIVIVENVRRALAEHREPSLKLSTAARAVAEVARPVGFSVLIICIVLVPLFTLQGIEGKMFAPLAATMILAMLASFALALTVVPVLAERFLPQEEEREFSFVRRLHRGYLSFLDGARRRKGAVALLSVLSLGAAAFAWSRTGTEFMPPLDEGAIAVNLVRLPNASLEGSVAVATFLEGKIRAIPEVETVVSKTGRAEISEDPMGPEQTDLVIMLKDRKKWRKGIRKEDVVEAVAKEIAQVPGVRPSFSQPIALRVNELISGVKSDLAVKVYGEDLGKLKGYADRAAAVLGAIEGAEDVKVEQVSGMDQVEVRYDRAAMARRGVTVEEVNGALATAVTGETATRVIEGSRRTDAVVRLGGERPSEPEELAAVPVSGEDGVRVPLGSVASVSRVEGPAQIGREKGMRRVAAEVNVRGRDLGGFVDEAKGKLSALEKELPPGYFLEYGGQFENQQRAMRRLSLVVPAALALVLALLYLALGGVRDALLVVLNLPFALVGGILAVWAFGMHLSVSAAVAFIVLLGIAVQNGVVLVAYFRQLREEGRSVEETVRTGCDRRFRPLLMTALTSFIGHLPMLYATGSGADIQKPLAVVVMGGLVTSTLLTLVVLPTVYEWFEARAERAGPGPAGE